METALPAGSFYGRERELNAARRLIEQRAGGLLGFSGIGGIGKSTLLAQIALEARRLAVTPYVVFITATDELTPVGFFRLLLDGLRATGKTTRRRMLFFADDTLEECEKLLHRLEQQEVYLQKRVQNAFAASDGGTIGAPTIILQEKGGPESTALLRDLLRAFGQVLTQGLPETVSVPPAAVDYMPRRLLILLVDTIEEARPELLQLLSDLCSGVFSERVVLFCAGRHEQKTRPGAATLLNRQLEQLDEASCNAWLTRAGINDLALRKAINSLCQGVPLLLQLSISIVQQARQDGQPATPDDFNLPEASEARGREAVERFLVDRFIERFERGGSEGHQLSLLLRYGCVARTFKDYDLIRALDIPELSQNIDPLVRGLRECGLARSDTLHPVLRRTALIRLAQREPKRWRDLVAQASAYYQEAQQPDEYLALLLLAKDPKAGIVFLALMSNALEQEAPSSADRLIQIVAEEAGQQDLAWELALARSDLALYRGNLDEAQQQLASALSQLGEQPERLAAFESRLTMLEPLKHPILLLWWLPRQSDSPEVQAQMVELSQTFINGHQHQIAASLLNQALAMSLRLNDPKGTATALLGLGEALFLQHKLSQAQGYYGQALALLQLTDDQKGTVTALIGLGEVLFLQDKLSQAQIYYEQALALCRQIDNRRGMATVFLGLGDVLRMQSKPRQAQGYHEQALTLFRQEEERWGAAKALRGLGDALRMQDEPRQAQSYYEQALALYRQIDDQRGTANTLQGLGYVLRMQDEPRQAQGYHEQALALYRQINDRHGIANALQGLGYVLRMQDEPRQAQGYYEQALALYRQINDRRSTAHALGDVGDALRMQNQPRQAQGYYEQALALYRQIDDRRGTANALGDVGDALRMQNQPRQAQGYYEQALALYRQIDDRRGTAHALRGLGDALYEQAEPGAAKVTLQEALRVAQQIERLSNIPNEGDYCRC